MKIYRVGGAVRDALLGLPVQDIDYVVTGSSPEQMVAAGYTPVGKDFPVFLHPVSKAEYALARTERKSAPGYRGFVFHCAPDVTLEQDLQRRDLTINAMAIEDGSADQIIIDPFGGQRDVEQRIFRHVSDAFEEDPVRILRIARFAARFHQFSIAPETMQLMQSMVQHGEVDALVPERVWQEIARGLMESHPSRMLQVLHDSGALERIMPELAWSATASSEHALQVIDFAARQNSSLAVRWAALLVHCTGRDQAKALCERIRVPNDVREIALITCAEHRHIRFNAEMTPEMLVVLLERCDAFRRPARFHEIIDAARCSSLMQLAEFPQQNLLELSLNAAQSIPSRQIAQSAAQQVPNQPLYIAEQIFAARVAAVGKLPHFFQG